MLVAEKHGSSELSNQQALELASISLLKQAKFCSNQEAKDIKSQVWDEETTRFAEVLDGPVDTSFDFFIGPDGLQTDMGTNLTEMWSSAVNALEVERHWDRRLEDIYKLRVIEQQEGNFVEKLAQGEIGTDSLITISPYPEDLERIHGIKFLEENGFNPSRKLGFVREYTRIPGGVRLRTASVDNSSIKNWQLVVNSNYGPTETYEKTEDILSKRLRSNMSIDELIGAYDKSLGNGSVQGIKDGKKEETWQYVLNQPDILSYYFTELQKLADNNLPISSLLKSKQELTYKICATLENRYSNKNQQEYSGLTSEISSSDISARAEGRSYSACGISLSSQSAQGEARDLQNTLQISHNSMKCVNCPFCKKTVDAKVTSSSISCPECRTTVNKNTGKVTEGKKIKKLPTFKEIIEEALANLFATSKKPKK